RDWSVTGVQTCALPIYAGCAHPFQCRPQAARPAVAEPPDPRDIEGAMKRKKQKPRRRPAGELIAEALALQERGALAEAEQRYREIGRASCRGRVERAVG